MEDTAGLDRREAVIVGARPVRTGTSRGAMRTSAMTKDTPIHVLIAEDDVLVAWALRAILEEAGYHVTLAHDGVQALALQAQGPVDVLMTDFQMPRLDGRELIRRLRATRPALPVVMMTGAPDDTALDELRDATEAGIVILAKPVSPPPVIAAIQTVLGFS
ncbi:response regulator [Azospirillum brasilense]|nr:response regulator [Azospirillum argentinense]